MKRIKIKKMKSKRSEQKKENPAEKGRSTHSSFELL